MDKGNMIFGTRAVIEAIKGRQEIEKIFVQSGLANELVRELISLARESQLPLVFIPQQKLNRMSSKNHQGVICMLSAVRYAMLEDLIDQAYGMGKDPFFLILDRVTDVRNFGALARTAECAGITGIIIAARGNAPITGDAMKTSAGALSHLPVCRVDDLRKAIQNLKSNGIHVVACTEKTETPIYAIDMGRPVAIVLGSEEDGISPTLLKDADALAGIPMYGQIQSLNVSVAAGIVLYEAIRQKQFKKG